MGTSTLTDSDWRFLRCPVDLRPLSGEGTLTCDRGHRWPVVRGLPRLFEADEIQGNDKLLNVIYDRLAALHDPAVTLALPLCGSGTEDEMRARYIPRLELTELETPADGTPVRILEIGMGTGANVSWIRRAMRPGIPYELWGVDLAEGMLDRCRRRLARDPEPRVRLAMADAHALPFADASFDRVFHIGATNNYRDPERAVAEMCRVAKPGTPIVMVDERLDADHPQSAYHRLMYRLVTFYETEPRDPVTLLPPEAEGVLDEQIARFFYCLTWRMPVPAAPEAAAPPEAGPAVSPGATSGPLPYLGGRRRRRQRPRGA